MKPFFPTTALPPPTLYRTFLFSTWGCEPFQVPQLFFFVLISVPFSDAFPFLFISRSSRLVPSLKAPLPLRQGHAPTQLITSPSPTRNPTSGEELLF